MSSTKKSTAVTRAAKAAANDKAARKAEAARKKKRAIEEVELNTDVEFYGTIRGNDSSKPSTLFVDGKKVEVGLIAFKHPKTKAIVSAGVGAAEHIAGLYTLVHDFNTVFSGTLRRIKRALLLN